MKLLRRAMVTRPTLPRLPRPAELRGWALGFTLAAGLSALPMPGVMSSATTLGLAIGGPAAIRSSAPGVELRLEDGRTALLAGVIVPEGAGDRVQATLAPLLARAVIVAPGNLFTDRYGRLVVHAATPDGRSLQRALLEAGAAVVQPLPGEDEATLAELLAAEAVAERAGRGIWRESSTIVVAAEPAAAVRLGQFALIEGRVLQATAQQRYFYLNFGSDWRTDTTARIDRDTLRAMQRAGFDPAGLEGRRVRLRGTLFAENGPMIELWTHQGIEILP